MESTIRNLAMTFAFNQGQKLYTQSDAGLNQVHIPMKTLKIRVYPNTPQIQSRSLMLPMQAATEQEVLYTEQRLGSLLDTPSPGTYLNLNTYSKKDLRARTVLNKLIVDNEIYFSPSADCISPVYFWIQSSVQKQKNGEEDIQCIALRFESRNTFYIRKDSLQNTTIDSKQQDTFQIYDSLYDMTEAFFSRLSELSEKRLIVALGFDCAIGKDCLIERLVKIYEQDATVAYKSGVESQLYKFTHILMQTNILPNVFFHDVSYLAYHSLNPSESKKICGIDIAAYIKLNGGTVPILSDDSHKNAYMVVDYIQQCLSEMQRLNEARNLLLQRIETAAYMQLPINYVLYETLPTCIQLWMMRIFRAKRETAPFGMLIQFNSEDAVNSDSYDGAYIKHVPEDLMFKPLMFVAEGDFFSLYPTVMVAHNISPETLLSENTIQTASKVTKVDLKVTKVDLNFGIHEKPAEIISFQQNSQSILSSIITPLFEERKAVTNPVRKATIKSILVSIYGILGSVYSPFYSVACARAITALGRKACLTALSLIESGKVIRAADRIVCANTDSVSFTVHQQHITELISDWPKINEAIQTAMESPLYLFQLEIQKFSLCSIYSTKIKQCIRLFADFQLFISEIVPAAKKAKGKDLKQYVESRLNSRESKKRQEFRATVKAKFDFTTSFAFSRISNTRQQNIHELSDQILMDILGSEQFSVQRISEMLAKEETDVEKKLKSRSIDDIRNCAELIKSSNDVTFIYLKNTYGVKRGCFIVPICRRDSGRRQASSNWVDLDTLCSSERMHSLLDQVDIGKLVYTYYQPIKKFFDLQGSNDVKTAQDLAFSEHTGKISIQEMKETNPECCVRIETVVKPGFLTNFEFLATDFESLEQMILSLPKESQQSIHEVFLNERNRMFFDIDFEHAPENFTYESVVTAIDTSIRTAIQACYKIHVAGAKSQGVSTKVSFHVVVDISCDRNTNRYVAQIAELNLRSVLKNTNPELKIENEIFDLAVYGLNRSLRLPFCGKIKKNVFEDRRLVPLTQSTLKDFFISNVAGVVCELPFNIMLDTRLCVDLPDCSIKLSKLDEDLFRDFLASKTPDVKWHLSTAKGSLITARPDKHYMCPVCTHRHDSRGLFAFRRSGSVVVNCFSNQQKATVATLPEIPLPQQQKKAEHDRIQQYYDRMTMPVYKEATRICEQKDISYQLDADLVFIISDMGTAKSKQLKEILEQKITPIAKKGKVSTATRYETVICLGFRKTFVTEFAKKFGLVSYENISGAMDLATNPRMIIQVDSLMRLNTSKFPQLLIVDEIESILSKLLSCSNSGSVCYAFLSLLKNAETVIAMDGLMESRTIQYLSTLRNTTNVSVTLNLFKPRKDYKMLIYPYKQINAQYICNRFVEMCGTAESPKRIYGMITSYKLGEFIRQHLVALGKKVVYYHGENGKIENTIHGEMTQQALKDLEFTDVNTYWKNYDIVLHTSSVTAGISFEAIHFDAQINVFNTGTCDAGSFFQGSHRVRNIGDKEIITFIEMDYTQQLCSPAGYSDIELDIGSQTNAVHTIRQDDFSQLVAWLKAREGCLSQFRLQLLLKYIRQMDYKVSILPIPEDAPKQKIDLDCDLVSKIASFQLSNHNEESNVPSADQQAYDHKLNLFYMFTPAERSSVIDTFTPEQISLLHKQRYFQKLRKSINYVLSCQLGTTQMKEMKFLQFRDMMNSQLQNRFGFEFTDLDTVKFAKDTLRLIEEVQPLLIELAKTNAPNTKAFKKALDEALKEKKPRDPKAWVNRVTTQLASHAKDLGINRRYKSTFAYLERICKLFTLKIQPSGELYIPADLFLAVQESLIPKLPKSANADSDTTSTHANDEDYNDEVSDHDLELD